MNHSTDLETTNIEDLVKNAKQVQNQMRQTINTLSSPLPGFNEREDLSVIWDSATFGQYVKNVVAEYMVESSPRRQVCTSRQVESNFRTTDPELPTKKLENTKKVVNSFPRSHGKKIVEPPSDKILVSRYFSNYSVDNKIKHQGIKLGVGRSTKKDRSINSKEANHPKMHEHGQKTKEILGKRTLGKRELPLKRFAGSSQETIDFSNEHPNLELCTTATQSTVFPRRFHKSRTNQIDPSTDECVNLAVAKMTECTIANPAAAIPFLLKVLQQNESNVNTTAQRKVDVQIQKKTWKEVFLDNKSTEKPKVSKVVAEERVIDIISNPHDGLYQVEKDGGHLSKPKKCSFKRFPVMYIRPECRVQRVATISIQGDTCVDEDKGTLERNAPNVGYVECKHEGNRVAEKETYQVLHQQQRCPMMKDKENISTKYEIPSNKFIDAVESKQMNKSEESNPLESSSKTTSTDSSFSSTSTSTVSSTQAVEEKIQELMEKILKRPTKQPSKSVKISVGTQCGTSEVSVQTDFTRTQSESSVAASSPRVSLQIHSPSLSKSVENSESPSSAPEVARNDQNTSMTVNTEESQETLDDRTFVEDDIGDNVFDRRYASSKWEKRKESSDTESMRMKERVKRRRKKKMPTEVNNDKHFEQQPIRQFECRDTREYSRQGQVNTVTTEVASRNRSMEKEVKRAVKIFLTSLATEECLYYPGQGRLLNFSNVQNFSRWQPISRRNYESFSSSDEVNDLNELSSLSISSLSTSEEESRSTGKSRTSLQSEKGRSSSRSEGEILSIGEV